MDLPPLNDDSLLARLEALVHQERENAGDIIEHLAEVDRRELAVDRGYSTLFDYCLRKLRYSQAAAYLRIRAARAAARFPRILSDLRSGAIHLDAVARLAPHLTAENADQLLDRSCGLSKREVLALTATLGVGQAGPERDVVRPLPAVGLALEIPPPASTAGAPGSAACSAPVATAPSCPGPAAEMIAAPPRVRLAFTADESFLVMVKRLRSLLRHKHPAGRLEDVLSEAVSSLLAKIDPGQRQPRRARTPREGQTPPKRSRRIPAAVKSEVWRRDGGRCAYVAADGTRCLATDFLEYDHIQPYARGGRSDEASNLRLLCRPHNLRLARKRFGLRRPAISPCSTVSGHS